MFPSCIWEFQYGIAATSQIMLDPENFSPEKFRAEWCESHFPSAPEAVAAAVQKYFAAFALHPGRDCAMLQDQQTWWWGVRRLLKKLELPPDPCHLSAHQGLTVFHRLHPKEGGLFTWRDN